MDRVSNLPDEVRCHILSFLPTKQAAVTSALSKSWRNLWKLVPNLDIDDSEFLHPEEGKGERDDIRQSFVDFVDSVLAFQGDSPIDKFSLKCITRVHPDFVNSWISNVLERGVSDLDLYTDFTEEGNEEDDDYMLPPELFVSKTLVKLKLRSDYCVNWLYDEIDACLPMLKSLYIHSGLIFCGDMESFLATFPALEELQMANMEWRENDESEIMSSASLKKLHIRATGCEAFENPKCISFDTPNLLYLNYSDLVAEDYPLVNMGKLFEARINLMVSDEDHIKWIREPNNDLIKDYVVDVVRQYVNVVKLMKGIQNIQQLHLTSDTLEVLTLCCESMPVFKNLKILGLKSDESRGWQAVPALLRNCPHLEFLSIEGLLHYVTDKCGDACDCIPREDKGRSLISCPVKKLRVRGFRGTTREKEMIRHFLDFLPCLDVMEIDAEANDSTNFEVPRILKIVAYKLHGVFSTNIDGLTQSALPSEGWSQTQLKELCSELAPHNKERSYNILILMQHASSPGPTPATQEMFQENLQMQLDAANAKLADLKERQQEQEAQLDMIVDQNPMSQDYLQMQLDAANAKLADLKERQQEQEAHLDMVVDQNPMSQDYLQMQLDAANAKLAELKERQREACKARLRMIVDQNPMIVPALRARIATELERAKVSSAKKKRDYDALSLRDILAKQNLERESGLRALRARHSTDSERAETSRDREMTEQDKATAADGD